jgi:prolyl-tRNA editing enzyme YbaK/EbsC (Cys-tRNA(Pro) deacylase)
VRGFPKPRHTHPGPEPFAPSPNPSQLAAAKQAAAKERSVALAALREEMAAGVAALQAQLDELRASSASEAKAALAKQQELER